MENGLETLTSEDLSLLNAHPSPFFTKRVRYVANYALNFDFLDGTAKRYVLLAFLSSKETGSL